MSESTSKKKYDGVAMTLHWLMALFIAAPLLLGPTMEDMPDDLRLETLMGHSALGITILLLASFRLFWRRGHTPPAYPETMPDWQKKAAKGVTHGLYFLMFYQPIVGILHGLTYTEGAIQPAGLFTLTQAPGEITQVFHVMHAIGMLAFYVLLALHIGAAGKHLLIDKDGVFQRMLPFTKVG